MISLESLMKTRELLWKDATDLVERKGKDYNRKQQVSGDTLFNLRVPTMMGIVESPMQTCLMYMSSKQMRLSSLWNQTAANKNESFRDSTIDLMNYTTYLQAFHDEDNKVK